MPEVERTGPLSHDLKPTRGNEQKLSSMSGGKSKKRERSDRSLEASKRERHSKPTDSAELAKHDHFLSKKEDSLTLHLKDGAGLVSLSDVDKLVDLMQQEHHDGVRKACDAFPSRANICEVLAATEQRDCLNRFVELGALSVLDGWLQEAHRSKSGDGGSSKEGDKASDSVILALLRSLERLPVDLNALKACSVGKSVNNLRSYRHPEIQRKARRLVDVWKKRVEEEMNRLSDSKPESGKGAGCSSKQPQHLSLKKNRLASKEHHVDRLDGTLSATDFSSLSAREEKSSCSSQSQNYGSSWSSAPMHSVTEKNRRSVASLFDLKNSAVVLRSNGKLPTEVDLQENQKRMPAVKSQEQSRETVFGKNSGSVAPLEVMPTDQRSIVRLKVNHTRNSKRFAAGSSCVSTVSAEKTSTESSVEADSTWKGENSTVASHAVRKQSAVDEIRSDVDNRAMSILAAVAADEICLEINKKTRCSSPPVDTIAELSTEEKESVKDDSLASLRIAKKAIIGEDTVLNGLEGQGIEFPLESNSADAIAKPKIDAKVPVEASSVVEKAEVTFDCQQNCPGAGAGAGAGDMPEAAALEVNETPTPASDKSSQRMNCKNGEDMPNDVNISTGRVLEEEEATMEVDLITVSPIEPENSEEVMVAPGEVAGQSSSLLDIGAPKQADVMEKTRCSPILERPIFDLNQAIEDIMQEDTLADAIDPSPYAPSTNATTLPPLDYCSAAVDATGTEISESGLPCLNKSFSWKDCSARSAFRPAEPRQTDVQRQSIIRVLTTDVHYARKPLDIDLNVADDHSFEERDGSLASDKLADRISVSAHFPIVKGEIGDHSLIPLLKNSGQTKPSLDLNCPYDSGFGDSDHRSSETALLTFKTGHAMARNMLRDFDLNDGPTAASGETASHHVIMPSQEASIKYNVLAAPAAATGLRNSGEMPGLQAPWISQGRSCSTVSIPNFQGSHAECTYTCTSAQPYYNSGLGATPTPFCNDVPKAVAAPSGSTAVGFPMLSGVYPYPTFAFGGGFSLIPPQFSSSSVTLDESTASSFPPMSPVALAPRAVVPNYARPPLLMNVPRGVSERNDLWERSNFDLNSCPEGIATNAGISRHPFFVKNQVSVEDHMRMFQQPGEFEAAFKRREFEGARVVSKSPITDQLHQQVGAASPALKRKDPGVRWGGLSKW